MAFANVGALLSSKYGPLVVQGGLTGIGALYGAISPNRARELQDEVLQGYKDLRETTANQARGRWSPAEAQNIRRNAQPQLQAVAGSVASRGLGSSPAGAQIMAEAEQRVFQSEQLRAQQMENIVNRDAFNAASALADRDQAFINNLSRIAAAFTKLRARGESPNSQAVGLLSKAWGFASPGENGYTTVTYTPPEQMGQSGYQFGNR